MRHFLLNILVFMAACACVTPSAAQTTGGFEDEFKAFKDKISSARSAASEEKNAAKESPLAVRGASPLGVAADLPVSAKPPATSFALAGKTPEEMQAALEAEEAEQRKKIEQETFDEALKMLLPLKPEQIRKMLDTFKGSRQAAEDPIAEPVPKIQVETVSLDPSVTPSLIKTSPGRVTTLTVLDATGSPWPVQDISWAGKFDVTGPEEGGHVIRITPQAAHGIGNISIRLVDLITPVTFTLQTGLDEVYYRFDARVPKQGPLARVPLIANGGLKAQVGGDENLVQILDGTPPASSEKLRVEGGDGRTSVWRVAGRIYLRTSLTLLSPSWDSSVTSADGMNVYTLDDAPVILLSDQGRVVRVHIAADEVTP